MLKFVPSLRFRQIWHMYELTLEKYQGPLDKLLELVLEKKLEIAEISLAEVTADFLDYLRKLEEEQAHPTVIADFIIVASKLVLIKSKNLLPSLQLDEEEEEDVRNLELRLKIYAEIKKTQQLVKDRWNDFPQVATREFLKVSEPAFYPPDKITGANLKSALARILGEFEKMMKPVKTIKTEIINLKKKIEEVVRKLTSNPVGFGSLKENGTKAELVVLFLAVLHLIKAQLVNVEQPSNFGEITIAKKNGNIL